MGLDQVNMGLEVPVHSSNLTLVENVFHRNFAYTGGALEIFTNSTASLSRNTFHNNSAEYAGGALFAYANNTLTLSENTFQNNSADSDGGAICIYRNLPKISPPSKISPPPSLAESYCKGSLLFKSTPTPPKLD